MKSNWIPVEDRLPEVDGHVDVWMKSRDNPEYGRRMMNVCYSKTRNPHTFVFYERRHPAEYVSHWMPKPADPPETSRMEE